MSPDQRRRRFLTVLCFTLLYLFWGSTYLAIDIAVIHIPPPLMCGVRFLVAGVFMLLYCRLKGERIFLDSRQMAQLALIGVLLLVGCNLTLSYAERYVPTGLAALLSSVTPLWFLVLDSLLLGHHRISARGLVGLALGAAGIVVLLWPELRTAEALSRKELWFSLALLGGTFSWAFGSVLSRRWQLAVSLSRTGWQITFAGLATMLLAVAHGDFAHVVWTPQGLGAMLYLVVGGSWIGYTSYIWLLGHVPTSKVSTYAYVNPVIAVFLGWLILKESINGFILLGSAIVVASVVLVTTAKVHSKIADEEMPAVEAVGD